MAAFDFSAELEHPLDFRLMQNTVVNLFFDADVLSGVTDWLADHGYKIVSVDTAAWRDEDDIHDDLAAALDFPDYYGRNFNALRDCLSDVATGDYGSDLAATGFVLVLRRYDRFARREPRIAHYLLETFAREARYGLLFGHRMMCLVQSDDDYLRFPAVGAMEVMLGLT